MRRVSLAGSILLVFALTSLAAAPLCAAENAASNSSAASMATAADYQAQIRPLLTKHCMACHGADDAQAGLRLDTLAATFDTPVAAQKWTKILDRIASGEMPPKEEPRIAAADKNRLTVWLNSQLLAAEKATLPAPGKSACVA